MALVEGNNRSVDTLLHYMTFCDINASLFFRHVYAELVNYTSFQAYLRSLQV